MRPEAEGSGSRMCSVCVCVVSAALSAQRFAGSHGDIDIEDELGCLLCGKRNYGCFPHAATARDERFTFDYAALEM